MPFKTSHLRPEAQLLSVLLTLLMLPAMAGESVDAQTDPREWSSQPPYAQKVLCLDPVVYLRLNGNFRDSASPGVHPGVGYGGVGFSRPGGGAPLARNPSNKAAVFDGVNDYIVVPSFASLNFTEEVTVMAWVKFDRLPSEVGHITTIVSKSGVARDLDLQAEPDNRFYFFIGPGAPIRLISQTQIQVNRWYFLAGTYRRGDRMDLYVDGVLESTLMGPEVTREENTTALSIGQSLVWPGRFFPGRIDEVAVFGDALAPGQIRRAYEASFRSCGFDESMTP